MYLKKKQCENKNHQYKVFKILKLYIILRKTIKYQNFLFSLHSFISTCSN